MSTPTEDTISPTTQPRMLASLRKKLKGYPYATILLRHGTVRTGAIPLPWPIEGPARKSFASAFLATAEGLSRNHPTTYVEGFAYVPEWDLFLEHAWVEDDNGTVYETTLDMPDRVAYLGIRFDFDDVASALLQAQEPVLFGDWARNFELLRAHRGCCELPWGAAETA
jgi:hypothetical protein